MTDSTFASSCWESAYLLASVHGHGWAGPLPKDKKIMELAKNAALYHKAVSSARAAAKDADIYSVLNPVVSRIHHKGILKDALDSLDSHSLEAALGGKPPKNEEEAWIAYAVHYARMHVPGLPPSLEHKTATGRVHWKCGEKEVRIEVHRPQGDDDSICVLQAFVPYNGKSVKVIQPDNGWRDVVVVFPGGGGSRRESIRVCDAEERHWEALDTCLGALGYSRE
jgi:hypothetical protein